MNERMLQILQMEALTALKFAELMEVQPSSVSHIISGRNNPGFDLISKIMQRMPNINPDWLINGTGAQKRDGSLDAFGYGKVLIPPAEESYQIPVIHNNAAETAIFTEQPIANQIPAIQIPETQTPYSATPVNVPIIEPVNSVVAPQQHIETPMPVSNFVETSTELTENKPVGKDSVIDKIVVFFTDGTFEMYNNKSR